MASYLPATPYSDELTPWEAARAVRDTRRAQQEILRYRLRATVELEKERIDMDIVQEAIENKMDAELKIVERLRRTDGSPIAQEIVRDGLDQISSITGRRIHRRFGG